MNKITNVSNVSVLNPDFKGLENLRYLTLYFSSNQISVFNLDFSNLTELETLDLELNTNQISNITSFSTAFNDLDDLT